MPARDAGSHADLVIASIVAVAPGSPLRTPDSGTSDACHVGADHVEPSDPGSTIIGMCSL